MHFTRYREQDSSRFCFEQHSFEQVRDFEYLGVIIKMKTKEPHKYWTELTKLIDCHITCIRIWVGHRKQHIHTVLKKIRNA